MGRTLPVRAASRLKGARSERYLSNLGHLLAIHYVPSATTPLAGPGRN